MRADVYKEEFFRTDAWKDKGRRAAMVSKWNVEDVGRELGELRGRRKDERASHLLDIKQEQEGRVMIQYWFEHLRFSPSTHPRTTELVVACFHLAGSAVMYFKNVFNRVRPWVLAPDLSPPIPLPGHPAYPSGHSTQMHLMALLLTEFRPDAAAELDDIALRVAVNRERAGLHYASDTAAGKELAENIFGILKTTARRSDEPWKRARAEWPPSRDRRREEDAGGDQQLGQLGQLRRHDRRLPGSTALWPRPCRSELRS